MGNREWASPSLSLGIVAFARGSGRFLKRLVDPRAGSSLCLKACPAGIHSIFFSLVTMAINPEQFISADRIVDLKSTKKAEVLDELIDLLATSELVTNKQELRDKILEREKATSTGVGVGMAIPHVKIASIKDFVAAIGRSKDGLDFESLDGQPTHLIVMIGCNNTQSAEFLKVLARIVTRLKQAPLQTKILEANSKQEIRDLFVKPDGVLA